MFYLKTKINDETSIVTELTGENVFTFCLDCGKEFEIDLHDVFADGGGLYGTAVYCAECSPKRINPQK